MSARFGMYRTTNGGTSWTKVSTGITDAEAIAFDPGNPQIVYADSSSVPSFYRSTDGGATWSPFNEPSSFVRELAIDPVNSATMYAHAGILFKTIDSGATWNPTAGIGESFAMDPANSQILYLSPSGLSSFTIKKSTDGGASFPTIATIPLQIAATGTVRALASLAPSSFTGPATAGTVVRAVQVTELRGALDAALAALALPATAYTDPSPAGVKVKAIHFSELRARTR